MKNSGNKVKESDTNEATSAELNQQIEDLKGQVEVLTKEHEAFPTISNLTKDFVQAQVTGDKERLNQLITDDVVSEEKGTEYTYQQMEHQIIFYFLRNLKNNLMVGRFEVLYTAKKGVALMFI